MLYNGLFYYLFKIIIKKKRKSRWHIDIVKGDPSWHLLEYITKKQREEEKDHQ